MSNVIILKLNYTLLQYLLNAFHNKAHKNITKLHKEKLGLDIPEDFFNTSKDSILNAVAENKQRTVFTLRPIISYAVAASIILLLGIGYWLQNNTSQINPDINNTEEFSSLIMVSSFFKSAVAIVVNSDFNSASFSCFEIASAQYRAR